MSYDPAAADLAQSVQQTAQRIDTIFQQLSRRIVGQPQVAKRLVTALVSGGHVLLEGMPGLAKTTAIKTLGAATALQFRRIQFTPDLLPADLIGTQIYDPQNSTFKVKQGPIFAHLVLADEINRAPAKVQSALLEAMEERQVTIADRTWELEAPFLVMATQNPVEQEGTYNLPEAQVDRFLFKVLISYGTMDEEAEIIRRAGEEPPPIEPVASREDICAMRDLARQIYVSDKVRRYIVELVYATREPRSRGFEDLEPLIEYGASPRASLALDLASKANALIEGRHYVTPQDIKDVGLDVLRHRVRVTYEAEAENIDSAEVVRRILDRVDVP